MGHHEGKVNLRQQIRDLELRLQESEETLHALRSGEVDAIVAEGPDGHQVFTLRGADEAYRLMVQNMAEGAVTLSHDGLILFANEQFASLVQTPLGRVIGSRIEEFLDAENRVDFAALALGGRQGPVKAVIRFRAENVLIPAFAQMNPLRQNEMDCICIVFSDLRERQRNEELLDAERLSSLIFQQVGEALLVVNAEGTILRASQPAEELAGVPVLHRRFDEVLALAGTTESGEKVRYPFSVICDSKGDTQVQDRQEVQVKALAGGRTRVCLLTVRPLISHASEVLGCVIMLIDITQRTQTEKALRDRERRFRGIFNSSFQFFGLLDLDGTVLEVNRAVIDAVGIQSADVTGQPFWDAPWWADLPEMRERLRDAVRRAAQGEILRFEVPYGLRNGTDAVVDFSISPVRDEEGNVVLLVPEGRDITSMKRGEAALRASEQRFRTLADAAPGFIWSTDEHGLPRYVNRRYEEFTGMNAEAISTGRWNPILHEEDRGAYVRAFSASVRERERFHARARFQRLDGEWRWIESYALPLVQEPESFQGHVGISLDITESVQADAALRESMERFRTLADHISQFAWMADEGGTIFWYNQRWYDFTGTTPDEMQKDWQRVYHPDHVRRVTEHMLRCFADGVPWEDTFPLRNRSGQFRWFLSRALPIRSATGTVVRWFGTNTDITEQMETERDLRTANEDLKQFSYAAAHDLREPLRNVRAHSEMLVALCGYDEQGKVARSREFIVDGVKRMEDLLGDLLEYTQLAAQEDEVTEITDCGAAVQKALEHLRTTVESAGAKIVCGQLPVVAGHEPQFVQLFQNLIGNAIKYRGEQTPQIKISARKRAGEWLISVKDNGIGIEPEYQQLIFGLFKRLHGKSIPGTGIGLAICQKIVERSGGRIWVESRFGEGSEFLLTLPVSAGRLN